MHSRRRLATLDREMASSDRRQTATLPPPNMPDYEQAASSFSWDAAAQLLDGLPGGGLNIAHEAVDRHAQGPDRDVIALRLLGRHGERSALTYGELSEQSDRFANVLEGLGIRCGERVFVLAGRIPELYVAALGTLKAAAVFCPLFSAFGPEPIEQRVKLGDGRMLVSTPSLYRRKVAPIRASLLSLTHVLLVGDPEEVEQIAAQERRPGSAAWPALASEDSKQRGGDGARSTLPAPPLSLRKLMDAAPPHHRTVQTTAEDFALLHFTSGTTGTPKGAVHVHGAVLAHHVTGRLALDLQPRDVFWCTADPGWVTGTSYGMIAPLSNGVSSVVDEADFDARRWYETLQREQVNVWYTAPTALRMLMRAGTSLADEHDLSALRLIASVGEPLNPEAVLWGQEAFGMPIRDNWWQTETGGIMIANFRSSEVRPGSMGRPLPGIEAAIARRSKEGEVQVERSDGQASQGDGQTGAEGTLLLADDGESGELVLRPGWPSMFRDYLGEHQRYQRCFAGGWYLTGDLARRDSDGFYWFVGRGDDVIKSAGHLIGPFEVESALLEHEAVSEAGVIGRPDEIAGEVVKAFVSLNAGFKASEELRRELIGFSRSRLGAAVAPREIQFVDFIPRNRSGKIMRRVLKARELGLPEGDLSTMEPPA